jgi:hypothetical protein
VSGHHRLAYEYVAGGVRYEQEQAMRLQVELVSDGHLRTAGSLGPGDPVLVWYDPAFPHSATVVPAGNGWPALPFILAAAGLLAVVGSLHTVA